jgi:hypothetical protein
MSSSGRRRLGERAGHGQSQQLEAGGVEDQGRARFERDHLLAAGDLHDAEQRIPSQDREPFEGPRPGRVVEPVGPQAVAQLGHLGGGLQACDGAGLASDRW